MGNESVLAKPSLENSVLAAGITENVMSDQEIERVRLWVTINHSPFLYDMVTIRNREITTIRLEQPSFLKQPIPRGVQQP